MASQFATVFARHGAQSTHLGGKSEKLELFEDFFQNIIKMYSKLTQFQKINCFHSLLRGDKLQAFRSLDDSERDKHEYILTM